MNQKLKRAFGLALALLVFLSTFFSLVPQAHADPSSELAAQLKQQYLSRTAWYALFRDDERCVNLDAGDTYPQDDISTFPESNSVNRWYPSSYEAGPVGNLLFNTSVFVDGEDHWVDCNNSKDMNPAFKQLGFAGLSEFNNFLFDCTKQEDSWCPLKDQFRYEGGDPKNAKSTPENRKAKILTAIEKHVEEKFFDGDPGDKFNIRGNSPKAEIYWFAVNVLESSDCKPTFYTAEQEDDFNLFSDRGDFDLESVKQTFSPPIKKVDDSGRIPVADATASPPTLGYPFVTYKIPKDRTIEGLDAEMGARMGGGECQQIVKSLSANAQAYQDEYIARLRKLDTSDACKDKTGNDFIDCANSNSIDTSLQVAPPADPPSQEIEFQCSVSFNPISWIMCPLISGFTEAINLLDKQINEMLKIDTDKYFGDSNVGITFKLVWANVRAIAISVLVVIGLIMVIGTAIGTGFFDAYTVKKVFPRLVVAIVLISVSWPLIIFIIDASNFLGIAVRSLIQGPFASSFQNAVKLDGAQLSLGSLGVVGLGLAIGPVGLLTLVAGAFMAVVVAFLTLILREILVILLAVLAPAAIAAYILPNTQKAGKLWWDFFSKALLAFPIISGFIAIGRVFAIVSQQDGGGGTVRGFIGFIAYFAPYFVLPKAFAMAGGAIGNLSGMVNDRSRGAFDRLKKVRQNKAQDNFGRMRAGNYFRGGTEDTEDARGNLRGRFNRGFATAGNINKAGLRPGRMGANMRTALRQNDEHEVEEVLKDHESGWMGDDAKNSAARFTDYNDIMNELARFDEGRFAGEANRAVREEAAAEIMRTQRKYSAGGFQRARVRAQSKTGTAYQYTDENGQVQFDAAAAMRDINRAYGADRSGAGKALAEIKNNLVNSGQIAGLAGYGTLASTMEDLYNDRISDEDAHNRIMDDAAMSITPDQALYGKPASAAAIGAAHRRRIEAIAHSLSTGTAVDMGNGEVRVATADDLGAATANAMGVFDAINRATPNNGNAMANELFRGGIDLGGLSIPTASGGSVQLTPETATIRELDQLLQGNEEYINRRGTYAAQTAAAAEQSRLAGNVPRDGGRPVDPTGGANTGVPR